jgi:hypothetical protein
MESKWLVRYVRRGRIADSSLTEAIAHSPQGHRGDFLRVSGCQGPPGNLADMVD